MVIGFGPAVQPHFSRSAPCPRAHNLWGEARAVPSSGPVGQAESVDSPEMQARQVPAESVPVRRGSAVGLFALMAAVALAYALLSQVRLEGFFASNWDLGINMQLLWTNTHGMLLYESGDYEFARANSFLYIHPAYVAIPISWIYRIWPTATTLFAIQGIAVASSALPLYLIGRQAKVSERYVFAGLAIYLVSFPILSALLFDFHWEALIPAEFLWTFYLWSRGRHWLAMVPALAGMLTLEVFPVLMIGLVAYFGYPYLVVLVRSPRQALARGLRNPTPVLPLVGLLIFAVAGHVVLTEVAARVLPSITGLSPVYPLANPYAWFGIYWWGVSFASIGPRLLYWLLLLGAFGFLPLLFRRRLLILSLPWFAYSVIMTPFAAYTQFGFQYAFIAAAPLAIGFIESLSFLAPPGPDSLDPRPIAAGRLAVLLVPLVVVSGAFSVLLIEANGVGLWIGLALAVSTVLLFLALYHPRRSADRSAASSDVHRPSTPRRPSVAKTAITAALLLLVAINLAMSPLNPENYRGEGYGGYSFTYETNPVYPFMAGIVGQIPAHQDVLASDNLFPFVANNPNAYSLLWYPGTPTYLPFNASHLPENLLLSSSQWFAIPPYLSPILFNQSYYGIVEMLYSTPAYPGSVYLFHLGFTGAPKVIEVSQYPSERVICGSQFSRGASGALVPDTGSECGDVIQSHPSSNLSGIGNSIWYGPYVTVLPGSYAVTVSLKGDFPVPTSGNPPVILLDASAQGTGYWYYTSIGANQLSTQHWTNFTYRYSLTEPYEGAEWRGYIDGETINGTFVPGFSQLNYIEIQYTS